MEYTAAMMLISSPQCQDTNVNPVVMDPNQMVSTGNHKTKLARLAQLE